MIEEFTSQTLFATPVCRMRVKGAEALNAALLDEGHKLRAASEGVQKSNRGGWHSEGNLFDRTEAPFVALRGHAEAAIAAVMRKVAPKTAPDALDLKLFAWMNINPAGGFNAPHTHPGAHWSGVYYVDQPEVEEGNSGMIEFLDPRSDLPLMRLLKAPAFRPKKKIRPAAGEIVIFPSYLVHWVYPNDTPSERVSIAFNGTYTKARRGRGMAGPAADDD